MKWSHGYILGTEVRRSLSPSPPKLFVKHHEQRKRSFLLLIFKVVYIVFIVVYIAPKQVMKGLSYNKRRKYSFKH